MHMHGSKYILMELAGCCGSGGQTVENSRHVESTERISECNEKTETLDA